MTNDENTQRGFRIYAQLLIIEDLKSAVNSNLLRVLLILNNTGYAVSRDGQCQMALTLPVC